MEKKVIRLTEEQLSLAIKHALNEVIDEIGGQTHAVVHNATQAAKQRQLYGQTNLNPRKSNIDIIKQGIRLSKPAADSLITPYKTTYLFHATDLLGTAAILIFDLKVLYELTPNKAILKGNIVFNDEPLYGSIIIEIPSNTVYYNYKGNRHKYALEIDPSKKQMWESLINQLSLSLHSRTV